jgi:hypothetical protein
MWESMRNHCKIRSIRRIHEERHQNNQSDHRGMVMGIQESNADTHTAHHHAEENEPELLSYD